MRVQVRDHPVDDAPAETVFEPLERFAPAGVRVDTHVQAGSAVPPHYDSLLAKIIAHGPDRAAAIGRLAGALGQCVIDGVATNLGMHRALLAGEEFAAGGVDTRYLERVLDGESAAAVLENYGAGRG